MSNDTTHIPTPRTDAACDYTAPEKLHAECKKLELELAKAKADVKAHNKNYAKMERLKRALAAARKDSERLDWMSSLPKMEFCRLAISGGIEMEGYDPDGEDIESAGDTLRAAIDAAMEGGER